MSKLVTIYGGSGFVGRYIARRMAKAGWRVRVAVRRPNEALFVKPYGEVGQVEPIFCNIRDDASVAAAMLGSDAVVNCVGILAETSKNKFDTVQAEGAGRVARLAAEQGIKRLVHISAIGADAASPSEYAQSKAEGEAMILSQFPSAVILRPSVIFGAEDEFFNRFADMATNSPIIPLVGAETRFQPVYVDDVAQAAVAGIMGQADAGIYELGGPEVGTFKHFVNKMLTVIQRRKLVLPLPFFVGRLMGFSFDLLQTVSLGLFTNSVITRDQVRNLGNDNVVSQDAKTFADLGIAPVSINAVLPDYLWCFRPSGQYAAIKASAKNLRS